MEDKVIVDFEKYHNILNELCDLRQLIIDISTNGLTEEIKERTDNLNRKYWWWC